MDRLDAMATFVAVLDEGSLAAAGRRLGRSPAAVTRAIAGLEQRLGTRLLHRTTRRVKLTEAGESYAAACRRVLVELDDAARQVAGVRAAPRGVLTITAPLVFGRRILRPMLDDFLDGQPDVQGRLVLLDRPVDLVDEGMDLALRIAHLPDSGLVAIRLGEVRRVLCAAPAYLAAQTRIGEPADLSGHACILSAQAGQGDSWTFPAIAGGRPRTVRIHPRLIVNGAEAAIASAAEGRGITRVLSYQITDEVKAGRLKTLLESCEPSPLPVHFVAPEGRLAVAKVRAFVDFAAPRLKAELTRIAATLR
jgi:DNA-binding transcriptional LysR family regulator